MGTGLVTTGLAAGGGKVSAGALTSVVAERTPWLCAAAGLPAGLTAGAAAGLVVVTFAVAFAAGFAGGWAVGFTAAWVAGRAVDFATGFATGFVAGFTADFAAGFTAGLAAGCGAVEDAVLGDREDVPALAGADRLPAGLAAVRAEALATVVLPATAFTGAACRAGEGVRVEAPRAAGVGVALPAGLPALPLDDGFLDTGFTDGLLPRSVGSDGSLPAARANRSSGRLFS